MLGVLVWVDIGEIHDKTHSLLFRPILFCRIPISMIGFFSMHADRFSDFHKTKKFTEMDRQNELKC